MQIEDYFDIASTDDIRVRGTRVGIESILDKYLHGNQSPEAIADQLPTVSLEQVYATILFYLNDRAVLDGYLQRWLDYCQQAEAEFNRHPPPGVKRLRRLKENLRESTAA